MMIVMDCGTCGQPTEQCLGCHNGSAIYRNWKMKDNDLTVTTTECLDHFVNVIIDRVGNAKLK